MKKIIKLTESELSKLFSLILQEDIDLDAYDDSDFYDAFLILFKDWVSKKIGEDYKKYPISFLLRKYGRDFEKDMDIVNTDGYDDDDEEEDINYREYDKWRIVDAATKLIQKGKYSLPNLNTDTKFTERYKKALPFVPEHVDIPKGVAVEFEETTPNRVILNFTVDFPKYISSEDSKPINTYDLVQEIKDFLSGYLGVEFGNIAYGRVDLEYGNIVFNGFEDWVKNVLNKKIKKDIKQLPNSKIIHSIRFSKHSDGRVYLRLIYKDVFGRSKWTEREEFKKSVREYIKKQGYNTDIFKIED